jgi:hypothetical protein
MSYLLRVQLPDRPGSLGALAVALGSVGADIISLDVVERTSDFAIDDLVVDMPHGSLPDTLLTAAERLPGVRVDSVRPYADVLDTHRELELIDQIAMAPSDRLQVLVDGAPRVLRVGWATVVGTGPDGDFRAAGSAGAPETYPATLPWKPWRQMATSLAAAPLGEKGLALVLGRPGGPQFRPSEVARLGYLAGIIGTILL